MRKIKACLAFAGYLFLCLCAGDVVAQGEKDLQGFENLGGLRQAVQATYTAEIGVTETSENDGPRIAHYRECVSRFNYPVSWCAIFVMYVYDQNNVDYGGANEWVPTWSREELVVYDGATRGGLLRSAKGLPYNDIPSDTVIASSAPFQTKEKMQMT